MNGMTRIPGWPFPEDSPKSCVFSSHNITDISCPDRVPPEFPGLPPFDAPTTIEPTTSAEDTTTTHLNTPLLDTTSQSSLETATFLESIAIFQTTTGGKWTGTVPICVPPCKADECCVLDEKGDNSFCSRPLKGELCDIEAVPICVPLCKFDECCVLGQKGDNSFCSPAKGKLCTATVTSTPNSLGVAPVIGIFCVSILFVVLALIVVGWAYRKYKRRHARSLSVSPSPGGTTNPVFFNDEKHSVEMHPAKDAWETNGN